MEAQSFLMRCTAKVDYQTRDDEEGDQDNCSNTIRSQKRRPLHVIRACTWHSRLMIEKTNSDSPNHFTPKMLIAHAQMQMAAVYAA